MNRLPLGQIFFVGYFVFPLEYDMQSNTTVSFSKFHTHNGDYTLLRFVFPLPITPVLFLNFSLRESTAEVVNKRRLPRESFHFHLNDKLVNMFIYPQKVIKILKL